MSDTSVLLILSISLVRDDRVGTGGQGRKASRAHRSFGLDLAQISSGGSRVSVKLSAIHRPGIGRVGSGCLAGGAAFDRRLLALDVFESVKDESVSVCVLGNDRPECGDELFVNVGHEVTLQSGSSACELGMSLNDVRFLT